MRNLEQNTEFGELIYPYDGVDEERRLETVAGNKKSASRHPHSLYSAYSAYSACSAGSACSAYSLYSAYSAYSACSTNLGIFTISGKVKTHIESGRL